MACSEGCHQGLQLRRRGALDHAVYQRAPRSRESQARTVRSVRDQDGADGGPNSASSRNPSWTPCALSATIARHAIPYPAADRQVLGDRELGAEPRSCLPFVKGRAGPGQPDASPCSLLKAEMIWAAQGPVHRVGGPATAAVADSRPVLPGRHSPYYHRTFVLSCKDPPGEPQVTSNGR